MIEKLFNFYPEAYSLNDFMYAFSTENPQFPLLLGIAAFTFFIGYMEYVYSFKLIRRENSAPFQFGCILSIWPTIAWGL